MLQFPESHLDLLRSDTAILATIGSTGYPQVTAVWFLLDDDGVIKLSLNTIRQKVKNLRHNPACTLFIIDRTNPARTVEVRANAELQTDKEYAFADKLGKKYGADLRKIDKPNESRVMVILHPEKINATDLSRK
jgi:PPOX class probable F420-dependent enzyme